MDIVVVEDEIRTRNGIIRLISKISNKYNVIGEASNGIDGIKVIEKTNPQLVIVDIKMPQLNGLDMLQELKKRNILFKSIVLTGFAEFEFAKEAISLGVFEYLLKPITVEDLQKALERVEMEILKDKEVAVPIKKSDEGKVISLIISKVLSIIKERYAEQISLEAVASSLHVTPEYLSSLFYKEVGKNYITYLKEFRVNKAKELMISTELKIYEIAERVGYSDPKYFCRVFKSVTGLPTGKFITMYK